MSRNILFFVLINFSVSFFKKKIGINGVHFSFEIIFYSKPLGRTILALLAKQLLP